MTRPPEQPEPESSAEAPQPPSEPATVPETDQIPVAEMPVEAAPSYRGASLPRWRQWTRGRILAAAGVAVAIAVAVGGIVYAATDEPAATHASTSHSAVMPNGAREHHEHDGGGFGSRIGGLGSHMVRPAMALHGQFVVPDGNGGYQTDMVQTGKVTAVSGHSITATSDDNFTQTYTVNDATRSGTNAQVGDMVRIVASAGNGKDPTAAAIFAPTMGHQRGGWHDGNGGGWHDGNGGGWHDGNSHGGDDHDGDGHGGDWHH